MMEWKIKSWEQLSKDEIYAMLRLRTAVFVVEQNCPYQECDGRDQEATHILGCWENQLIATARIIPAEQGQYYLGRIVVDEKHRKQDFGKQLMKVSMDHCLNEFGATHLVMSAQTYLTRFYQSFGFQPVGEGYLEDDIPHIRMELWLPNA